MNQPSIELSIVIPFYNERERIGQTIKKIIDYFKGRSITYELILVDDGSRDGTVQIIEDILVGLVDDQKVGVIRFLLNDENRGKGCAVKKGVLASQGRYVLFSDADLSTPIEEVERFLSYLKNEGYNMVIGSRGLKESNIELRQSWLRESMGRCFNRLMKSVVGLDFMDTQCGFKCFDQRVVKEVFPKMILEGFTFDVEMLYLTQRAGLKIKEVPVRWKNASGSKVHIISDSLKMLLALLKIPVLHKNS